MAKKLSRKDKRRLARTAKEKKLNSSPLEKRARKHAIKGFAVVVIFIFVLQIHGSLNKAVPTGLTYTGVVVELAASSGRRQSEVLAVVKLENGRRVHISYRGRYIGESLNFSEYQNKLSGNYSYRLISH